jgi:cysteinyl-tRNA synthetase, unknown class
MLNARKPMRRLLTTLAAGLTATVLSLASVSAQTRENRFLPAKSWAFQLVNLGAEEQARIAASPFDVVVIDSEHHEGGNWQDGRPMTRAEIEKMQKKPDGSRRQVIAYFSVGEAEDYRKYWKAEWNKKRPGWIGKESKEWKHNFYVQYWEPTWQDIVLKFADQVIDSGFDGFYIDRADAYYNFGDTKQARDRMEAFVLKLVTHIRAKKPDAQILVQNAEELLDRPAFVQAIDGIAKEDLLYGITHKEEPNKKVDIDWSTDLLKKFQVQGKKVFVIEYLSRKDYVADAKARLDALGFTMYMGPRGLASLNMDAADIANYAGPRRGTLDPTPANPSAQTAVGKAKNAAKSAVALTKEKTRNAVARVKAATQPKKAN